MPHEPRAECQTVVPIMFDAYRMEQDSFGAGLHRGAPGVTKVWHYTHGDVVLYEYRMPTAMMATKP